MNPNRTRHRRKLTAVAAGVALLVLVGWFLSARPPQARAHGSGTATTVTAAMESGDLSEKPASPRSRLREPQGNDEQIRRRVESMLNIKPNEIAIMTVPTAALDQCFGGHRKWVLCF